MILALTLLITLPVLAVCWDKYFLYKKTRTKGRMIAVKCCATLMCVLAAAVGTLASGNSLVASLPFWGALLCMVGDGLLEVHFLSGMAAFGAGHVVFIGWIYGLFAAGNGSLTVSVVLWLLLCIGVLRFFRCNLRALGKALPAFLAYAAVLMAMAAMALTLPLCYGWRAVHIALGGALFAASDMFVGKGMFERLSPAADRFALAIYYAAVYLLALGAWV